MTTSVPSVQSNNSNIHHHDHGSFKHRSRSSATTGSSHNNPGRSRRRKPLQNVIDWESVELEQTLMELHCTSETDRQRRQKACEYLESILAQWCRSVEEEQRQKAPASLPKSFASALTASPARHKSFARAVGASSSSEEQSRTSSSNTTTAALISFGSYRLGVHGEASDLDLLALAPPYVKRSDFFTSLVTFLQNDTYCQQVHPIPTAYTPVIKFILQIPNNDTNNHSERESNSESTTTTSPPLQIDLVFARVADATKLVEYQKQKRKNQLQPALQYHIDDTDLQDLDEAGVRSLNGARVAQMLLECVPDVPKFQTVLRAVKHWAVVHGIYSNVLGFLGGVNWAILVAYVCRQHPNASAASTLAIFFRTFASWKWNVPVMLTPNIQDVPPITNVSTQTRAVTLPAWNPATNPRDGLHIFPIITPAYPSMNSSYNLDFPQLRRIQEEMIRASQLLQHHRRQNHNSFNDNKKKQLFIDSNNDNMDGEGMAYKDGAYRALLAPSQFFKRHKHFLQVNIRATTPQDFVEWFRLVESRIRLLINNLETTSTHALPFARFFDVPLSSSSVPLAETGNGEPQQPLEKCFFIALRFAPGINEMNMKHLAMDFLYKVNSWQRRKPTMDLSMAHITDDQLPWLVWESMKGPKENHVRCRNSFHPHKDGTERSVGSENTAPATDDEEEEEEIEHSAKFFVSKTSATQTSSSSSVPLSLMEHDRSKSSLSSSILPSPQKKICFPVEE
jgi:poly(A) polymerase